MRTRNVICLVAVASTCSAAGGVYAAPAWKVFASAADRGEYSVFASADAKVVQPGGLAVRAFGAVDQVSWYLNCTAEVKPAKAGLYVVAVDAADTCSLSGHATADKSVKLQLLRR